MDIINKVRVKALLKAFCMMFTIYAVIVIIGLIWFDANDLKVTLLFFTFLCGIPMLFLSYRIFFEMFQDSMINKKLTSFGYMKSLIDDIQYKKPSDYKTIPDLAELEKCAKDFMKYYVTKQSDDIWMHLTRLRILYTIYYISKNGIVLPKEVLDYTKLHEDDYQFIVLFNHKRGN